MPNEDWKERATTFAAVVAYIGAGVATAVWHHWAFGASDNALYWVVGIILRVWLWPGYWGQTLWEWTLSFLH